MTNEEAVALKERKVELLNAMNVAYSKYVSAKRDYEKAEEITEVFEGHAIHFEENYGQIHAHSMSSGRRVICKKDLTDGTWDVKVVQEGKKHLLLVWDENRETLLSVVRDYVATGYKFWEDL